MTDKKLQTILFRTNIYYIKTFISSKGKNIPMEKSSNKFPRTHVVEKGERIERFLPADSQQAISFNPHNINNNIQNIIEYSNLLNANKYYG